jgi:hypothetical protein
VWWVGGGGGGWGWGWEGSIIWQFWYNMAVLFFNPSSFLFINKNRAPKTGHQKPGTPISGCGRREYNLVFIFTSKNYAATFTLFIFGIGVGVGVGVGKGV